MLAAKTHNTSFVVEADENHYFVYVFNFDSLGQSIFTRQNRLNQVKLTYDTNFNLLSVSRTQLLNEYVSDYVIAKKASGSGYWFIVTKPVDEELLVYSWENGQLLPQYTDSLRLRNINPFQIPFPQRNTPDLIINAQGDKIGISRKTIVFAPSGSPERVSSFVEFDTQTGDLYNEMQINWTNTPHRIGGGALLFSPDGNKLFMQSGTFNQNGTFTPNLLHLDLTNFDSTQTTNSITQLLSLTPLHGNINRYFGAAYLNQSDLALFFYTPHNSPAMLRMVVHEIQNANQGPLNLNVDTVAHDFGSLLVSQVMQGSGGVNRPYQLPQLFLPNRFNIRAPAEACPNDSVAPALGDYLNVRNVRWNFGDGSAEQNKRFPKHAYSLPGTYTITAYFQHCSNIDTVYHPITILDTPASVALPNTFFCANSSLPVYIQPVNGQQYLWSTGDSLPHTNISSGGWHWVEQRNACFSRRDSFFVEAQLPPQAGLPIDTNVCEGDVLVLSPQTSAYSWQWQNGSTQPLQVTESGTYALLMTNACGTFVHQCRVEFQKVPSLSLKDTSRCEGQFLRIELPEFWQANYRWSDGNTERIRVLTDSGSYEVSISNPCGESSSTIFLRLNDCVCHMYLPTAFSPNADGLNDQLRVATRCELSQFEMEVYDRWGRLLFRSNQFDRGWDGYFNGQLLPPGAYPFVIRYTPEGRNPRVEKGVVNLIR